MRKEGSAILVAMLVVSLIGVVGFGLSRLAVMQLRLSTINDASIQAYHAAEAGLEYGLYQYSVSKEATISANPAGTTVVPPQQGKSGLNDTPLTATLPNSTQSYDLLMTYQTYYAGTQNCLTTDVAIGSVDTTGTNGCQAIDAPLIVLQPDESVTFSKPFNTELFVRAEPATIPPQGSAADAEKVIKYGAVEITGTGINQGVTKHDLINLWHPDRAFVMNPNRGDAFHLPLYRTADQITIRYYGSTTGTDYGPLSVAIQLRDDSGNLVPFDSGQTLITSIGKVAGHERRLQAKIDRRTNQVIGIFDYALYAENALNQVDAP